MLYLHFPCGAREGRLNYVLWGTPRSFLFTTASCYIIFHPQLPSSLLNERTTFNTRTIMAPTLPVNPIDLATLLPSLLFPSPALPAVADQELLASSSPSFKPADLAAFFPNLTEDMPVVELGMETIELEINPEAGTMVTTATTTRKILFPEDASNVEGYDAEDLEGNQVWTGVEITEFDVDVNMLPPFVAAMELGTVDGNEMGYNGQSFDGGVPVTVVGMPAGLSEFADLGIAGLGPVIVVDLEDTVADGVWDVLDVKVGGAMDRKGGMVEQMGQIRGGVWNRLLEGDDADMPAAQRDGSISKLPPHFSKSLWIHPCCPMHGG